MMTLLYPRGVSDYSIPFHYDGYLPDKDYNGQTAIMLWIRYCQHEYNIPKVLYCHCHYPNWQTDTDKNGQTPLMLWIRYRQH